jgi:hypothetical protein
VTGLFINAGNTAHVSQLANCNPTAQMNKRRWQRQTYEDEEDNTFQPLVKYA